MFSFNTFEMKTLCNCVKHLCDQCDFISTQKNNLLPHIKPYSQGFKSGKLEVSTNDSNIIKTSGCQISLQSIGIKSKIEESSVSTETFQIKIDVVVGLWHVKR